MVSFRLLPHLLLLANLLVLVFLHRLNGLVFLRLLLDLLLLANLGVLLHQLRVFLHRHNGQVFLPLLLLLGARPRLLALGGFFFGLKPRTCPLRLVVFVIAELLLCTVEAGVLKGQNVLRVLAVPNLNILLAVCIFKVLLSLRAPRLRLSRPDLAQPRWPRHTL